MIFLSSPIQHKIMKILLIGAFGTIGKKIAAALEAKHEIIKASRTKGDVQIDISDEDSIIKAFESVGTFDAVVCIAGEAKWNFMDKMTTEDYYLGIQSKLMGQVNVARHAIKHLSPGGSITLSTGILADDPVTRTTSAAMVNGAIHSFTQAAALEMPDGKRINVVSLGLVEDSAIKYADYFPGHNPISMDKAANAYVRSLAGKDNGHIIRQYS